MFLIIRHPDITLATTPGPGERITMDGNGEKGDGEASTPSGISSVFDDRVDDENLLTVYETENLSLLEPIYKRFDEQFSCYKNRDWLNRSKPNGPRAIVLKWNTCSTNLAQS